jgi:hypothetical protein
MVFEMLACQSKVESVTSSECVNLLKDEMEDICDLKTRMHRVSTTSTSVN